MKTNHISLSVLTITTCIFFSAPTHAGMVTFDPLGDALPGSNTFQFDVYVSTRELPTFNWLNMVLGSHDLSIDSFEYATSWSDRSAFPLPAPAIVGAYPSDLFVGGFFLDPFSGDTLVGTLTVDISMFNSGTYEIFVNNEFDDGISGIGMNLKSEPLQGSEGLFGVGTVSFVPEPATLVLLGVGGFVLCRRGRR